MSAKVQVATCLSNCVCFWIFNPTSVSACSNTISSLVTCQSTRVLKKGSVQECDTDNVSSLQYWHSYPHVYHIFTIDFLSSQRTQRFISNSLKPILVLLCLHSGYMTLTAAHQKTSLCPSVKPDLSICLQKLCTFDISSSEMLCLCVCVCDPL